MQIVEVDTSTIGRVRKRVAERIMDMLSIDLYAVLNFLSRLMSCSNTDLQSKNYVLLPLLG